MNKRLLILLLFLLTIPTLVLAEGASNYYMGVRLGASFTSFNDGKWNSDVGGDVTYNYDANKDNTVFAGGILLGYGFADLPFRAELEYIYRTNFEHDTCPTTDGAWNVKTNLSSQTVMLNLLYDFKNTTAFTPFVLLGAGLAIHKTDNTVEPTGLAPDYSGRNVTEAEFAWTVGLGVAYSLTESCDIDLVYRYIDMGEARYENYSPGYDEANAVADMDAQEFFFGVRYKF